MNKNKQLPLLLVILGITVLVVGTWWWARQKKGKMAVAQEQVMGVSIAPDANAGQMLNQLNKMDDTGYESDLKQLQMQEKGL